MGKKIFIKVEEYYIIITMLCYTLHSIAPIVALFKVTPFYSFQKYLGIIGMFLIMIDIVLNKKIYYKKNNIFLYGIIFVATISSILTIKYGVKDNLFNIAWFCIMVYIFYNFSEKCTNEIFMKILRKIYYITSTIWTVAIVCSVISYLFDTGYMLITNPYTPNAMSRQGFLENRLFGVFMSINSAAFVTGLFLIVAVYLIIKEKKIFLKCLCGVYLLFDLIYIILSGSRSTYVMMLVCAFWGILYWFISHTYKNKRNVFTWGMLIGKSVLSVILIAICLNIFKNGLSTLPTIQFLENNRYSYERFISCFTDTVQEVVDEENITSNQEVVDEENIISNKDIGKIDTGEILKREDTVNGNVSNNRFTIWRDYLSVYKEIGLVGLSPCNYSYEIIEKYPELYIVKHIRDYYPNMLSEGKIYHPHNAYIMVYVSTGLIGIICLLAFLVLGFRDLAKYIIREKGDNIIVVILFALILVGCLINIVFDQGIFFVSNLQSCIFWISAGFVMKIVTENKEM